jgi:hypothetical protein
MLGDSVSRLYPLILHLRPSFSSRSVSFQVTLNATLIVFTDTSRSYGTLSPSRSDLDGTSLVTRTSLKDTRSIRSCMTGISQWIQSLLPSQNTNLSPPLDVRSPTENQRVDVVGGEDRILEKAYIANKRYDYCINLESRARPPVRLCRGLNMKRAGKKDYVLGICWDKRAFPDQAVFGGTWDHVSIEFRSEHRRDLIVTVNERSLVVGGLAERFLKDVSNVKKKGGLLNRIVCLTCFSMGERREVFKSLFPYKEKKRSRRELWATWAAWFSL